MKRDHLQQRGLAVTAALAALLVLAGLPAVAGAQPGDTVRARAAVYSNGVDFAPEVAFERAVVTVSGNGRSFRYEVEANGRLSIGLFDPEGQLLPDGSYTWELQLMPTEAAAARLRAGEADAWAAQSGTFTIQGSAIADPSLTEANLYRVDDSRPATRGAFGADRGDGPDSDAAVGSRAGVEARVNAAARTAPARATAGALLQPNRGGGDDSDTVTSALGRSLEPGAATNNQLSAQSRGVAPRPRSDGSNGRPRS